MIYLDTFFFLVLCAALRYLARYEYIPSRETGFGTTRFENVTLCLSEMGRFRKNGGKWGKCGKFWMLDGKMGNFGAKKAKKHNFDWQQGCNRDALVKAPKEKWKVGKS